ncbi:hypothetical protein HDU97_003244 [Phlyctochytrium planicorne]|nr:hypothetical protein HDU97_003244 [Phlyctochytrium planicorne]
MGTWNGSGKFASCGMRDSGRGASATGMLSDQYPGGVSIDEVEVSAGTFLGTLQQTVKENIIGLAISSVTCAALVALFNIPSIDAHDSRSDRTVPGSSDSDSEDFNDAQEQLETEELEDEEEEGDDNGFGEDDEEEEEENLEQNDMDIAEQHGQVASLVNLVSFGTHNSLLRPPRRVDVSTTEQVPSSGAETVSSSSPRVRKIMESTPSFPSYAFPKLKYLWARTNPPLTIEQILLIIPRCPSLLEADLSFAPPTDTSTQFTTCLVNFALDLQSLMGEPYSKAGSHRKRNHVSSESYSHGSQEFSEEEDAFDFKENQEEDDMMEDVVQTTSSSILVDEQAIGATSDTEMFTLAPSQPSSPEVPRTQMSMDGVPSTSASWLRPQTLSNGDSELRRRRRNVRFAPDGNILAANPEQSSAPMSLLQPQSKGRQNSRSFHTKKEKHKSASQSRYPSRIEREGRLRLNLWIKREDLEIIPPHRIQSVEEFLEGGNVVFKFQVD